MVKQMKQNLQHLLSKARLCEKELDWKSAIKFYKSALTLEPGHLESHHNLGIALRHDSQMEASLNSASLAANIAPEHPIVQFSLGVSLEKMKKITDAIEAYQKSIKLRPDYVAALSNLGRLLEIKGRSIEAIKVLERAISIEPNSIESIINLSNSYLAAGQPQDTIGILEPFVKQGKIQSDASLSLALNTLAVAAHTLGKKNTAIKQFKKAIEKMPHFAEAHENLAQTLLYQGKYQQAWIEYEWRWLNQNNRQSKQNFSGLPWEGEKLTNKTLFVYTEQGFGDVIQFVRFVSMIPIQNGRLILACHADLTDLLSTLPYIDLVIGIGEERPHYDRHIPLLSLPRLLGITEANIPSLPYLTANPSLITNNTNKIQIGLTWAGTTRHESDPYRNRSCPIEELKPLLDIPNIILYSVQTGPDKSDLVKINEAGLITDLSKGIQSFEDTAALISGLDILITVDTAVAHLAGSLGKTVWILLAKSSDWRWNSKSGKNLWYPRTRIFKQKSPGNWTEPLSDVTNELKKMIPQTL